MLHNSLLIRDKLKEINNNSMHKERRNPHKWVRKQKGVLPKDGEIKLTGSWEVFGDEQVVGIGAAIKDLKEFLEIMEVELDAPNSRKIILKIDSKEESKQGYKLSVKEEEIIISSNTIEFIWAGLVYLERQMMLRNSPILPKGIYNHAPSWDVQISQSPYGSNYLVPDLSVEFLSNDAFRLLTHYGINGMTIYGDWLCYFESEKYPELNNPDYKQNISMLKDAVQRAKEYGVKLYYVPVSPKLISDHPLFKRLPSTRGSRIESGASNNSKKIHNLCTSDPESLAIHAEVMSNLFRQVPELGGINLIIGGESYYHCYMRPDKTDLDVNQITNCERCANLDQEETVNNLLKVTVDAVNEVAPDAWVTAWPYSASHWTSDEDQMKLIRKFPKNIALLNTVDKDQLVRKENHVKRIWDYSIDYTGPADNLLKQVEVIKERNIDLFIKTETALGLEVIQYPYIPSMQRLKEKWENVRKLKPTGVLQSWMFFGMWGSRAEELGWWTAWHPEISNKKVIELISNRDFGKNAPQIIKVWENISEAVSHIPYIAHYFRGPEFIGPAHPILFDAESDGIEEFDSIHYYLQENEETFSTAISEVRRSLVYKEIPREFIEYAIPHSNIDRIDLIIFEYEKTVSLAKKAFTIFEGLQPDKDKIIDIFTEEKNLCELIYRTFLTTLHTYKFLKWKEKYTQNNSEGVFQEMVAIAKNEIQNTKKTRHIFVDSPWLDLSFRVDGKFPSSVAMIDRKINMMEKELNGLLEK